MNSSVNCSTSQKGFSLVEMMIVFGLAGFASIVVVQILQNSSKLQNTVSQRSDFDSIINQVEFLLNSQCDVNFKDQALSSEGTLSVATLYQAAPGGPKVEVISTGTEVGGIEVSSLVLNLNPGLFPPSGDASVLGDFVITALKDRGSTKRNTFSSQTMVRKLPISLTIDSSRVIKGCGSSASGIPSGAVLAFNSASCPPGWVVSDGAPGTVDLQGKNIIGVSPTKPLRDSSGNETHLLQVNELAPHRHEFAYLSLKGRDKDAVAGSTDTNIDNMETVTRNTEKTPSGGQVPFSIMDPYVALLYCQKI